jgi:hypothetical protein
MSSQNYLLYKSISAVGLTFALSKIWLKEENFYNNLEISTASVAGLLAGNYIGAYVGSAIGGSAQIDGASEATILQRAIEIGSSAGVGYAVNRFLLNNRDYNATTMARKIGVLALADVGSEFITDFLLGQPLTYLS